MSLSLQRVTGESEFVSEVQIESAPETVDVPTIDEMKETLKEAQIEIAENGHNEEEPSVDIQEAESEMKEVPTNEMIVEAAPSEPEMVPVVEASEQDTTGLQIAAVAGASVAAVAASAAVA